MRVLERHVFRVTRNGDFEIDDDGAEDLLKAIEEEIRRRRASPAVRLEIEEGMPPEMRNLLARELQIGPADIYRCPGPLHLAGLFRAARQPGSARPQGPAVPGPHARRAWQRLTWARQTSSRPACRRHAGAAPVRVVRHDVERLIEQAADDPNVLAIKQTLYRTSGDSPIVRALVEAAEAGKQVMVLIEIKARFDEGRNIVWARELEKAGRPRRVRLRRPEDALARCAWSCARRTASIRRYVHLGTGQLQPDTARIYKDLGLLTADPEVGAEVSSLFNYLTGYASTRSTSS